MKTFISLMGIVLTIGMPIAYGQGYVDIVFGDIQYDVQSGVHLTHTFAYPNIDILKNDEEAIITIGIPPVFLGNGTVSTHSATLIKGISVFPNPVMSELHLSREDAKQLLFIQLFDIKGTEVVNTTWNKERHDIQIKVGELISGSYYLYIRSEENQASQIFKILKHK
jgi:hypothetical protein